jgi:hypothetical protein
MKGNWASESIRSPLIETPDSMYKATHGGSKITRTELNPKSVRYIPYSTFHVFGPLRQKHTRTLLQARDCRECEIIQADARCSYQNAVKRANDRSSAFIHQTERGMRLDISSYLGIGVSGSSITASGQAICCFQELGRRLEMPVISCFARPLYY